MSTPTKRPEVLADERIAALHGAWRDAAAEVAQRIDPLHYAARDRKTSSYGRRRVWRMTRADALAAALARADSASAGDAAAATRAVGAYLAALAAVHVARVAYETAERDEYKGWARFFLVTSSDGHIHRSLNCSTCRPQTRYDWLVDLSGLTEADAVKAHGALLCTVCYPSAPVEWTNGREVEAAAKAAMSCPGSGTYDYAEEGARFGFAAGNGAVCNHCDEWVGGTPTRKLRRHPAKP